MNFHIEPRHFRDGLIKNGYSELAIRSEHSLLSVFFNQFTKILFMDNKIVQLFRSRQSSLRQK